MKKVLIALVAFGLTAAAFAVTVTNRGEVVTVTTLDDVVSATADTNVVTLVSEPVRVILSTDTDLTSGDVLAYTPEAPGQLLISLNAAGESNIVYVAVGWANTDWLLLK